jgi:hypothetical protein
VKQYVGPDVPGGLARMAAPEAPEHAASEALADPVTDALRDAGEASAANWSSRLDERFFAWYWPLMLAT